MVCCSLFRCGASLLLFYLFIIKPLKFLYTWYRNRHSKKYEKILKPGENFFAVVTGATDGIGLEYARQLAEKGYNLVLLSRTEEKLKRVAGEILEQYPQCKKIEYLAVDFSQTDIYDRIKEKLESLSGPIHVLVNNVGMSHSFPEYFTKMPEDFHLRLINTNLVSMTLMSEIVLRIMEKQVHNAAVNPARGVVINISSGLGCSEFPYFNSYSASKAYINNLSKILSEEHKKDAIIVQTVTSGLVKTNMSKDVFDDRFGVNADDFVRHALKTVGTEQTTCAHPRHKFVHGLSLFLECVLGACLFMKIKVASATMMRKRYFDSKKSS